MAMAAARIHCLVHHWNLVTIRGNSYRTRQHTELWHTLHDHRTTKPHQIAGDGVTDATN
jgi:hypothetical protein